MRRVRLGLALSLLMLGALLVPAGTTYATRPEPVDVTLTITSATQISFRLADGNVFFTLASTASLTGDLEGVLTYEVDVVVHPSGKGNLHVRGTFDGMVDGNSGTAALDAHGTLEAGVQRGQWVMGRGTDGLAGVDARGTFEGPLGGPIALSGWLHFDP